MVGTEVLKYVNSDINLKLIRELQIDIISAGKKLLDQLVIYYNRRIDIFEIFSSNHYLKAPKLLQHRLKRESWPAILLRVTRHAKATTIQNFHRSNEIPPRGQ